MTAGANRLLLAQIQHAATSAGLDAVGVTDTAPFSQARRAIDERKAAGLHAGMWFTYGRPERSTTPANILTGARSIVVCARNYASPDSFTPERPATDGRGRGTVAAYVASDAYGALRAGLERVCEVLQRHGYDAVAVCDDNRLVDRAAAARAGLGWLGHNTMLLSQELGSWTVLGSVVTTAELPLSDEVQPDGCGTCRRCQTACPTGALDTAGVLDANRCLAWLVQAPGIFPPEHRVALGDRLYGCDDCQTVCPFNGSAAASARDQPVELGPRSERATRGNTVDLVELLQMTDDDLMAAFGHWYIPRRRPEYLRRNALVVLANVGDPRSPAVDEALRRSLSSSSDVVAAHAVWAARRLGRDELVAEARSAGLGNQDPDGLVAAELARPVPLRHPAG
ncbi:tRNA epoxyqueuosine(34) reductase QueG [Candidatus Poriferisodalis sp.]|uniref:tRNA epoxyqueuosine(34) reductase QueG n=1 Tax=Candidatus Poriferisodalis sp. TaxID=3101277 RepID=UPI003B019FCA